MCKKFYDLPKEPLQLGTRYPNSQACGGSSHQIAMVKKSYDLPKEHLQWGLDI